MGNAAGDGPSTGKVIVLLSDGTGNSAGKLFKTNVWRLYQALDLGGSPPGGAPRQVAYYDDGVGTSSFRPLALLGGVFGWGLKRNILDLYGFLCRNWQPGDRICAFGFSRGAFTIRILVDMVAKQGVLRGADERELAAWTRDAYRDYRREYNVTGGLVTPLRRLRDAVVGVVRSLQGLAPYAAVKADPDRNDTEPEIAFVGVWDTVAAYGLPVSELTRGIDEWVWPLSMSDYKLSPRVKVARHALALDDERDTFHPLVWDERHEAELIADGDVAPDRMRQVWFAGMHADVGGGYPEDGLAHVSLDWMMAEAAATAGLRFRPEAVKAVKRARDPFAPMHDSRRGLAGYYRYQPRKIIARLEPPDRTTLIMQDPELKGRGLLTGVRVHESVLDRIAKGTDRYAPTVLPPVFAVVDAGGADRPSPEARPGARAAVQQQVWDEVWRRRVPYFATVGLSLALASMRWWGGDAPRACEGPQCLLSPVIGAAGAVLPGFLEPWVEAFARRPGWFVLLVGAIALLQAWSGGLQRGIQDRMRAGWRAALGPDAADPAEDRPGWVRRVRTSAAYQRSLQWLKWKGVPTAFGLGVVLVGGLLALALLGAAAARFDIAAAERSGDICDETRRRGTEAFLFRTSDLCWPTGAWLEEGRAYRVVLRVDAPWMDRTILATPEGFGSDRMRWYARFTAPLLRRSVADPWFRPMARIVPPGGAAARVRALEVRRLPWAGGEAFVATLRPPVDGRLELFVNDAVLPRWWPFEQVGWFYGNNRGGAEVLVEPVAEPEAQAR